MSANKKLEGYRKKKLEVIKGIQYCEEQKTKITNFVHKLNQKYYLGEISYEDYTNKLTSFKKRTPEQWIIYYNKYIKHYKQQLTKYETLIKTEERKSQALPIITVSLLILILGLSVFFLKPTITSLFVVTEETYTQDLNLIINESSTYELQLEQKGTLTSARITGKIIGENVKVYLENKLILDSFKLEKTGIEEITSLAISELGNESIINGSIEDLTIKENITNITEPIVEILFKDICIETCNINLNKTTYELRFEIENAVLELDSINYIVKEIIQENITLPTLSIENISKAEELIQLKAEINKPVKWIKRIKLNETANNLTIKLPQNISNIKVRKVIDNIKEEIKEDKLKVKEIKEIKKEIELIIKDTIKEVEVKYETEAPQSFEEHIESGKRITISGPDNIHYENVLAFTSLSNEVFQERIKLYRTTDSLKELVQFTAYDKNNNSLIDYIEWIVPSLSNQTYELIIEISKAEHLDKNRGFVSDVYEQVKALDNIWSETIPSTHHVRVTFERNLTSKNDITLYPRIVSGNPKIEVYEFNKTELIAEFSSLTSNQYNKVYLTNLISESQDVFDLRVVDGSIEIDYIIDPIETLDPIEHLNTENAGTDLTTQEVSDISTDDTASVSVGKGTLLTVEFSTTSQSISTVNDLDCLLTYSTLDIDVSGRFMMYDAFGGAQLGSTASIIISEGADNTIYVNDLHLDADFSANDVATIVAYIYNDDTGDQDYVYVDDVECTIDYTITNNPPTATALSRDPSIVYGNSSVNVSSTINDPDVEAMNITVTWYNATTMYLNYTLLDNYLDGSTMSAGSNISKVWHSGEYWNVSFNIKDDGDAVFTTSDEFNISYYTPNADALTQDPTTLYSNSTVNISSTIKDLIEDSNTHNITITWTNISGDNQFIQYTLKDNYLNNSQFSAGSNISGAWHTGETWNVSFNITNTGGENYTTSAEFTIEEYYIPDADALTQDPTTLYSNSTVNISSTIKTIVEDSDTHNITVTWYNGTTMYLNYTLKEDYGNSTLISAGSNISAVWHSGEYWNVSFNIKNAGNKVYTTSAEFNISYYTPNADALSRDVATVLKTTQVNISTTIKELIEDSNTHNITITWTNGTTQFLQYTLKDDYGNNTEISAGSNLSADGGSTQVWNIGEVWNVSFNITNTGGENYTTSNQFTISSGNVAPRIITITPVTNRTVTEAGFTNVTFNFTVGDDDEITDIVDASANATINDSSVYKYDSDCSLIGDTNTTSANYSCSISIAWFDLPGTWTVNVSIQDSKNNNATLITSFNLSETLAFTIGQEIKFPQTSSGDTNTDASNNITLNNTGNQAVASNQTNVTAYDLVGSTDNSYSMGASNFTVGLSSAAACTSTLMVNETSTAVNGALPIGNYTAGNGKEELFICLVTVPTNIIQQSYTSTATGATNWDVTIW